MRLEGKVAIVTGATSGIGRGTAELFAREGARVVVVGRTEQAGERVVEGIRSSGGQAIFVRADVAVSEDVQRMIAGTIEAYGKLDVLFNNAGMSDRGKVADQSEDEWHRIVAVNLTGTFLCMKYAVPEMIKAGGGSIINNSSMWAISATHRCSGAYAASKAGVIMLGKQAALHYAPNKIRVNSILPGDVAKTGHDVDEEYYRDPEVVRRLEGMQPLPVMATPTEIAYSALYLASDESSFVTGASLVIDGGMTSAEIVAGRTTG